MSDLPGSNSAFWMNARKHRTEIIKSPDCEHHFEYGVGREVVCKKCKIGYYLNPNQGYVKEGKLVLT